MFHVSVLLSQFVSLRGIFPFLCVFLFVLFGLFFSTHAVDCLESKS